MHVCLTRKLSRCFHCAKKREKAAPVHGTRTGESAKVEEGEYKNGAEAFLALDDIIPSQVLPVLFDRFGLYDLILQFGQNKCTDLCRQWFYRWEQFLDLRVRDVLR
jgi:hypothetical protein